MAERNQRKNRVCKLCDYSVVGKASKMKAHSRDCKKMHADAAAMAIMQKLQNDMMNDVLEGEAISNNAPIMDLQNLAYESAVEQGEKAFAENFVEMADERVLNAEGD